MRTKNSMEHIKTIMVFGVFDRLHPGHLSFLKQAKKYGKNLIVVVARDSAVRELKNKNPNQNEKKRTAALRKIPAVNRVLLGDKKQGSYDVIKKYKPDAIGLGYDQRWLAKDLKKRIDSGKLFCIKLIYLRAYYPHKYHTSRIKTRRGASRLISNKNSAVHAYGFNQGGSKEQTSSRL